MRQFSRHIFFDTETTGKFPERGDRLIEVGAVEYVNEEFTGRQFHALINPEREVHPEAARIHGYTWSMLKDKPLFRDIADSFLDFVAGAELFAHNADFDSKFMIMELKGMQSERSFLDSIVELHNTITLFRQLNPGEQSYSLDNILKRLHISTEEREDKGHGAILDAHLLARAHYTMQHYVPNRIVSEVTGEDGTRRKGVTYGALVARDPANTIYDYRNLPDRPEIRRIASLNKPLVRVQVSELELAAHQAYLASIRPSVPSPEGAKAEPIRVPPPPVIEKAVVPSASPSRFMRR